MARALALRSADIAMSGIPDSIRSARCTIRNSQPSITGIMRSSRIRSGGCGARRKASSASRPLATVDKRRPLVAQKIGEGGTDGLVVFDQEQTEPLQGSAGQHVWEAKDARAGSKGRRCRQVPDAPRSSFTSGPWM